MKSSGAKGIGCSLVVLLWIAGRFTCLNHEEQVSELGLSATIIPQVIYSKAARVKVTLALSDYPPDGTTVSAHCAFTSLFNFTMDDSFNSGFDKNNTGSTLLSTFQGRSADSGLLWSHLTSPSTSVDEEVPVLSETWKLKMSTVTFTDVTRSLQLVATCQELPLSHNIEVLQLRCSLSSDSSLPIFSTGHAKDPVAVFVADLSPAIAVNWAAAPPAGSPLFDRAYPNPAYVEVAPCPCDLFDGSCDVNCCCDVDCSDMDKRIFACIEGLPGGFQTPVIIDGHCTYQLTERPDWFPFLCLTRSNSPYLGLYYRDSMAIVRNAKSMRLLSQQLVAQGKLPLEARDEYGATDSSSYQYGDPILTIVGDEAQTGYLTLPTRIFAGQCIEASPLAFLVPQASACNVRVTPEACGPNSVLSATTYLMDGNASDILVVARKDMQEAANVTVAYFCEGWASDSGPEECDFTRLTPSYNASTGSCENVVHRVEYDLSWDGPEIVRVLASIALLPSFPVNAVLSQNFRSRYAHSSLNTSDNTTTPRTAYSGNPGYDIGKTLITGAPVGSNDSSFANDTGFLFMDVNRTESVRLASTGPGGACDARGQKVLFGIGGFSGCRLDVLNAFAEDCRQLRTNVLRHLCSLMPSTFVSKGGAPQQASLDDFIPIIREDLCENLNSTLMEDPAISNTSQASNMGICKDVPSYFAVTVLYAARGYLNGFPIYQIEGMRIRTVNTTLVKCRNPSSREASGCWSSGPDNTTSVFVTSSVEFAETPADLNPKTKRFWLIQASLPCSQDSCWSEMAYPFTDAQFGEVISSVTQYGLVLVALMAITLYLTRMSFW